MATDDELLSINQELEIEEDEEDELSINEVLEMMKPTVLNYKEPDNSSGRLWVFWNGEDRTPSSDVIPQNIISALSSFRDHSWDKTRLVQFWAPVTIDGQRLLTTVNQPFAFLCLERGLCKYRAHSLNCKFNVVEEAQLLPNSNYARVFLSGLPEFFQHSSTIDYSIVLPVFEPSSTSPVGVLEVTYPNSYDTRIDDWVEWKRVLKDVNWTTFDSRDYLVRTQNIQGLQSAKDEIETALEIICDLDNLPLAQAWIGFPYMDDNNVSCTWNNVSNISYLKSIKEEFALKVVEYFDEGYRRIFYDDIFKFRKLCDVLPLRKDRGLVGKSLLTHKPYFCKNISNLNGTDDPLMDRLLSKYSCFTICIRSIHTGSLDYVLQFIWRKRDDKFLLDSIVAAMKLHLPTFKVSSGEELGEELLVQLISDSMNDEIKSSEICITAKATPIPESFVREGEALCNNKRSTKSKDLSREDIAKHYGKTQKGAAENLEVHLSTFKQKFREYAIKSLEGPLKKGVSDSRINIVHGLNWDLRQGRSAEREKWEQENQIGRQIDTQQRRIIIVQYGIQIIIWELSFSSTTTELEERVSRKFRLSLGTFRLEYRYEERWWVSITDDDDLKLCMRLMKEDPICMRLMFVN